MKNMVPVPMTHSEGRRLFPIPNYKRLPPATAGTATTMPATESSVSEMGSEGEEEDSLGASGSSGAEWSGAEVEE